MADATTKTEQAKLSIPLLANCSLLALLSGLKWKLHLQWPLSEGQEFVSNKGLHADQKRLNVNEEVVKD